MGDLSRLEPGAVFHHGFDSRRAVEKIGVLPEDTPVVSLISSAKTDPPPWSGSLGRVSFLEVRGGNTR